MLNIVTYLLLFIYNRLIDSHIDRVIFMKKLLALIISVILVLCCVIYINAYPKQKEAVPAFMHNSLQSQPSEKNMVDFEALLESMYTYQLEKKIEQLSLKTYPKPNEWGLHVSNVHNRMDTSERVIALTFDACGTPAGNRLDQELINFLIDEQVPATLFINQQWIEANKDAFLDLAKNPLFQIENHGTYHKPLSMKGQSAYGIPGTSSVDEVINEVMENYQTIYQLTGERSTFFRSGTAHYDEVSVAILKELGIQVVNFDINGDAGATFSAEQVKHSLLQAEPGSIAILHMNQPDSGTAEGVQAAVPLLKSEGFRFVKLGEYKLQ
jgi:peptidoglycan/xylan/chitin deacetylase (PgdA/CDA1 family)